jgi:hypothetical protein
LVVMAGCLGLAACSGDDVTDGGRTFDASGETAGVLPDGGGDHPTIPTGSHDGAVVDATFADGGAPEVDAPRPSAVDAGASEAGAVETGVSEAGVREGGASEAGVREAGASEAGASEAGASCAPAGGVIPIGGTCGPAVTHCATAWNGDCWNGALTTATTGALWACGARCGDLSVGFSDGCATAVLVVEAHPPFVTNGSTYDAMMECVRTYLLSTRFDCVPSDGWITLHVDGCTLG